MNNRITQNSLTFSPKELLSHRPGGSLNIIQILEFLVFRFFSGKTYCFCLPVVLSSKEKNYINFKSFTNKKLNCLTVFSCKITYSLIIKELILYIRQKLKKYFNLLLKKFIHPPLQGWGFSELNVYKDKGDLYLERKYAKVQSKIS